MTAEWFLANLPYDATEQEIRDLVKQSGALVSRVRPIHDYESGKFRGFAFADVDIAGGPEEEERARRAIFGSEMVRKSDGKVLSIHVERSRNPKRAFGDAR